MGKALAMYSDAIAILDITVNRARRRKIIAQLAQKSAYDLSNGDYAPTTYIKRNMDNTARILEQHSTKTLTSINKSFSDGRGLHQFIHFTDDMSHPGDIRTAAHYRDSKLHLAYSIHVILKHVRSSLGVRDLTQYRAGTEQYDAALAVISVAMRAVKNHHYVTETAIRKWREQGYMSWEAEQRAKEEMHADGSNLFMTPELARLIMQYPDRASDISDYLREKAVAPKHADFELLLMRLTTEAKALSDGLL